MTAPSAFARLGGAARREAGFIATSRVMLLALVVVPFCAIAIVAAMLSQGALQALPVAVVDNARTSESQALVRLLSGRPEVRIAAQPVSDAAAEAAHNDFTLRFSKNAIPDEMPEVTVTAEAEGIAVANLLKEASLVETTSEALRMIKQNAVKRDGEVIADGKLLVTAGTAVWQVGKRKFARVTVQ